MIAAGLRGRRLWLQVSWFVALLALGPESYAQAPPAEATEPVGLLIPASEVPLGGWAFYWENDTFKDTDQYYTNGMRFVRSYPSRNASSRQSAPGWMGGLERLTKTSWLERLADRRCGPGPSSPNEECLRYTFAWTVGHYIYTPADITQEEVVEDDRPYGGVLYFGGVFHLRDRKWLHVIEGDVGLIGPLSLAEPFQKGFHELQGVLGKTSARPEGWRHQLGHEPVLQLNYELKRQLGVVEIRGARVMDWIPSANLSAGSLFNLAGVGAMVRLGYNIQDDFGPTRNAPTLGLFSREERFCELYVFLGADRRRVWGNRFIDGSSGLFGSSHGVSREPYVSDLEYGFVAHFTRWPRFLRILDRLKVSFTRVERSREFAGQPRAFEFDSLSITFVPPRRP